jgi:uncharacterized membrane protein
MDAVDRPMRGRVTRNVLTTLAGIALIGLLFLLPDLAPGVADDQREVVTAFRGRIESIHEPVPDADAETPPVPIATVRALDGPRAGETLDAYLAGPGGSQSIAGYRPGDEVVVTITQGPEGSQSFVSVSDRWRIPLLQLLSLAFVLAVVVVGGWHGARALVALGLTIAVILKILLPLVIAGVPPVPLAVLAASAVTVVTIVLTEGAKRSSLAAILGTTGALALTGLLAAAATGVMGFTYTAGSDLAFLTTSGGQGLDLRGILLAAFILGAVGVLDDVTVTQAALVDELADKGLLRGPALFASAMGIGRSHIAATVNTLFLAYVGAGLPLLVVLLVSRQPAALVLNDEVIATEIVRTVVGSLGIVAAVPLTTFIASAFVTDAPAGTAATGEAQGPAPRGKAVVGAGVVIAALLAATALLPLTAGSRPALDQPIFDPNALPSGGLASQAPGSAGPGATPASEPTLIGRGEAVPIVLDGKEVGTVTVSNWVIDPAPAPATGKRISVVVAYAATGRFALDAGGWEILLGDGTEAPLTPSPDPAQLERTLEAGETLEATLEGELPAGEPGAFVVYLDRSTSTIVFAVAID